MTEFAKPCIKCGKKLRNIDNDCTNQPYEGTAFTSHGHYGSTIFDPMDGSFIELNVCDECLRQLRDEKKILKRISAVELLAPAQYEDWKAE